MNKITIPALLLGVVMIAGAFAFMPVQEASTVHTSATNLGNQDKIKTASNTFTPAVGNPQTFTVTIDMNEPFELLALSMSCESGDTGTAITLCDADEDMTMVSYLVDGQTTATSLGTIDQIGNNSAGTTIVLSLSENVSTNAIGAISASDQIVFNMDSDSTSDGVDDQFEITVTATIRIASGTTFATANIVIA